MKSQPLKKILLLSILSTTVISSFSENIHSTIVYYPILEDSLHTFIVKASINNTDSALFVLDTGTTGGRITLDSAFFFDNKIDKTNIHVVSSKLRRFYWDQYYEGDISVSIGSRTVKAREIYVRNRIHSYHSKKDDPVGVIGSEFFRDKMTIIDFENNRIAFVDSLPDVSDYDTLHFLPPRGKITPPIKDQKFVQINGFKNKQGKTCSARLLFDTGSSVTGLLFKGSYANTIRLPQKVDQVETHYPRYYLDSLTFGNKLLYHVPVRRTQGIYDIYEHLGGGDGLLGIPLMKRFNFILDYKNDILYYKPNKWFDIKNKKLAPTK
jgi:hypothetical protein